MGSAAGVHTIDEMVRHVLGKLRKMCTARKEGEDESGGEREPVLEGLAAAPHFLRATGNQ